MLLLAAAGGALAYYLDTQPDKLATEYRNRARPEHEKLERAMRAVYTTLNVRVFGASDRFTRKAKTPEQYVVAIRRDMSRERRQLRPAVRAIRNARRALAGVDERRLTEVPSGWLLDGRGKLADAEQIPAAERRYLADARRFLDEYDELVDYTLFVVRFVEQSGVAMGRGFAKIPDRPTTPEQVAGPIDAVAADIDRFRKSLARRRPPPIERSDHRAVMNLFGFYSRTFRELADAVRARDLAEIEATEKDLSRGSRRYQRRTRGGVAKLLTNSQYSRAIRRLRDHERRLEEAYAKL